MPSQTGHGGQEIQWNDLAQMTDFAYPYHDIDTGGHKRQRAEEAGQQSLMPNEGMTRELLPHMAYDPVRSILQHNTTFVEPTFYNFANINPKDGNLWFSEPSTQIFQQNYNFEDDNSLLTSQPFCEQTTSSFATSSQDSLSEPQESLHQSTVEIIDHVSAHSLEAGTSPQQGSRVTCFGMVRSILSGIRLHCLTCP